MSLRWHICRCGSRGRERFGVTVVAVRRCSVELVLDPPPETVVSSGDKIRVFGLREQIKNLMPEASPTRRLTQDGVIREG